MMLDITKTTDILDLMQVEIDIPEQVFVGEKYTVGISAKLKPEHEEFSDELSKWIKKYPERTILEIPRQDWPYRLEIELNNRPGRYRDIRDDWSYHYFELGDEKEIFTEGIEHELKMNAAEQQGSYEIRGRMGLGRCFINDRQGYRNWDESPTDTKYLKVVEKQQT